MFLDHHIYGGRNSKTKQRKTKQAQPPKQNKTNTKHSVLPHLKHLCSPKATNLRLLRTWDIFISYLVYVPTFYRNMFFNCLRISNISISVLIKYSSHSFSFNSSSIYSSIFITISCFYWFLKSSHTILLSIWFFLLVMFPQKIIA